MLNVAFICATLNMGGAESSLVNIANGLVGDDDFRLFFILARSGGGLESILNCKVNKYYTNRKMLLSLFQLIKKINQLNPDCIISGPSFTNIIVLLANIFCKKKVIVTHHNFNRLDTAVYGLLGRLFPFLCKWLYSKAYRIVAVSEGVKDYLIKSYQIASHKIVVIHNPIFLYDSTQSMLVQEELFNSIKSDFLISIGRLSKEKNIDLLIDTFALIKKQYPQLKLLIIGDGPELSRLKENVISRGLKNCIVFAGSIVAPYFLLKKARCLVSSSITEALPTVLIEALFLGVNIVSTPTPGAVDILDGGNYGFISSDFTAESLSKSIEKCLGNSMPEKNLIDYSKRFSKESAILSYKQLLAAN